MKITLHGKFMEIKNRTQKKFLDNGQVKNVQVPYLHLYCEEDIVPIKIGEPDVVQEFQQLKMGDDIEVCCDLNIFNGNAYFKVWEGGENNVQ